MQLTQEQLDTISQVTKGHANQFAKRLHLCRADQEDLAAEATCGILRTINAWDPARGPFRAYANAAARRHLWGYTAAGLSPVTSKARRSAVLKDLTKQQTTPLDQEHECAPTSAPDHLVQVLRWTEAVREAVQEQEADTPHFDAVMRVLTGEASSKDEAARVGITRKEMYALTRNMKNRLRKNKKIRQMWRELVDP